MKIFLLCFAFTTIGIATSYASYQENIYKAFTTDKLDLWRKTLDDMNSLKTMTDEQMLEAINYHYGYIAWCIGNKKNDIAEKYLKIAYTYVYKLEKKSYQLSYIYSYKAVFIGFEIGLASYKAPIIGFKSFEYINAAIKADPNNFFAYHQQGNMYYYLPSIVGGSKNKAIEYYQKAVSLIEKDKSKTTQNWNYLSLLVAQAQAYTEIGKNDVAKKIYEKILKIEPNFHWVKNVLYPNILKKT